MTIWIDCLRHGEVVGKQKYRGITDDPLSDSGWIAMQAKTIGKNWHQVISSPLQRCANFARDYSHSTQTPLTINPHFQEYNFGDWDGLTVNDIKQRGQDDLLQAFWQNPHHNPPPNAEKIADFHQRIQQGWQALLTTAIENTALTEKHLLLITHAGVIRALVSYILSIPDTHQMRIAIPLASMTGFRIDHYQREQHVCLHYLGHT